MFGSGAWAWGLIGRSIFTARIYATRTMLSQDVRPSVSLSVCHMRVFCRNCLTLKTRT